MNDTTTTQAESTLLRNHHLLNALDALGNARRSLRLAVNELNEARCPVAGEAVASIADALRAEEARTERLVGK